MASRDRAPIRESPRIRSFRMLVELSYVGEQLPILPAAGGTGEPVNGPTAAEEWHSAADASRSGADGSGSGAGRWASRRARSSAGDGSGGDFGPESGRRGF